MTSPWRAPSALRMPISRVRSVTLTSMMFMITMPPTTSEMQVTGTTMAAIMPSTWSMKPRMASGVSVSKLSGWPGRAWKRVRSTTRVSSSAPVEVEPAARLGTAEQGEAVAGTVHAVEGGDRDVDRVVLVAAEGGAQAFLHADHGELDAFDADDLVERRGVAGEERGAHGVADDGHKGARALFLVGEEAAVHHADIADAGHGGGDAEDGAVFADQVFALDVGDVLAVGAVEDVVAVDGFDEARVVGADRLVALELCRRTRGG